MYEASCSEQTAIQYVDIMQGPSDLPQHSQSAGTDSVRVQRRRGRPCKNINQEYLAEAMGPTRNISLTKLAHVLGVHRHTLRRNMKSYGIKRSFSSITDAQLDLVVKAHKHDKPNTGVRYLLGYLRSRGIRVQKDRVYQALHRVDGLGQVLRQHTTIQRREYHVSRPNALWHCDGHHKLIMWGIVIHGFIDGYCRTVGRRRLCIYSSFGLKANLC